MLSLFAEIYIVPDDRRRIVFAVFSFIINLKIQIYFIYYLLIFSVVYWPFMHLYEMEEKIPL